MNSYTIITVFLLGLVCVVLAGRKNQSNKCRYTKGDWSECDPTTNKEQRTLTLRKGVDTCEQTKQVTRKCRMSCRYTKEDWSDCDAASKTKTRVVTLKKGGATCEKKKTITKKCKKGTARLPNKSKCKYRRGTWSDCDTVTNQKTRIMTLKKGKLNKCEETKSVSRPCKKIRPKKNQGARGRVCKYMFSPWTECDQRTNTMSRTLTLKRGDPASCLGTKVLSRKCRKRCKFEKGTWSKCKPHTSLMERTDTLIKGSEAFCDKSRVITRKCGAGNAARKCKYDFGNWTDCDATSNERTKIKHLIKGNPEECEPEKVVVRSCTRPNNKERCFFGQWGDFGACMNGVMTKHRPVLQGGVDCQRRGVKTKACGEQ